MSLVAGLRDRLKKPTAHTVSAVENTGPRAELEVTIETLDDTYLVVKNVGLLIAQDVAIQPMEEFGLAGAQVYNWRRRYSLRPDSEQRYLILRQPGMELIINCRLSWIDSAGSHISRRQAVELAGPADERPIRHTVKVSELRTIREGAQPAAGLFTEADVPEICVVVEPSRSAADMVSL